MRVFLEITKYFFCLLVLTTGRLAAQDLLDEFEEFEDAIASEFEETLEDNKRDYWEFVYNLNAEFDLFIEESDKEFAQLLLDNWEEFSTISDDKPESIRKPKEQFQYSKTNGQNKESLHTTQFSYQPASEGDLLTPSYLYNSKAGKFNYKKTPFLFYGSNVEIYYDPLFLNLQINSFTNFNIASYWENISKTNYAQTLYDLKKYKDKHNLNDWGYLQLVKHFCSALTSLNTNNQNLLSWFLLVKSGYNVKTGIGGNNIYLLYSCENKVYHQPKIVINNKTYYVFDGKPESLQTYRHENKGKSILLSFEKPLLLGDGDHTTEITFAYNEKKHTLNFKLNKNYVYFYKDFPNCDLNVYSNSFLSQTALESLSKELMPKLEKLSTLESLEFLLAFVQTGFTYQVDKEQFGHEKFLFPEETLFYQHSDCEDLTLLFAWMVNEYLNIPTIGVDYKGHILSGIPKNYLKEHNNAYKLDNEEFVLADAAYRNAPLGIISPNLKDIMPEFVPLFANSAFKKNEHHNYSGFAIEDKIRIGNKLILAGSAYDTVRIANETIVPGTKNQVILLEIARGNIVQVLKTNSKENCYVNRLQKDADENIYLFGTFENTFNLNGHTLDSTKGNEFVLKLTAEYEIEWVTQINTNLDSLKHDYFSAILSKDGGLLSLSGINLSPAHQQSTLVVDENTNQVIVSGPIRQGIIPTYDTLSYQTGSDFDILDWLIQENKRLIKAKYSSSTSPLISIINFLTSSNLELTGSTIAKSLLKSTSSSLQLDKKDLQNIQNVKTIKKSQNYIVINTDTNDELSIEKLLFTDNSRLKVISDAEQIRLFVYSGIKLQHNNRLYKVNYILINSFTGEILYDYDKHYRRAIPARQIAIVN